MTFNGILQIAIFCIVVIALTRPLGGYMTRVFNGDRNLFTPVLRPVERLLYAASGVNPEVEQSWLAYGVGMLLFSLALCDLPAAGRAAAEPTGLSRLGAGTGAEHGDQLRHQHELAVLFGRKHD